MPGKAVRQPALTSFKVALPFVEKPLPLQAEKELF